MSEPILPAAAVGGVRVSRRAVLLAGGGLLLAGCGGPEKPTIRSRDYDGYGSEAGRLRTILDRRAKAVTEGDEQAYLADLDPSNPELIQREKRVFANLRQFEWDEFRYVSRDWIQNTDSDGSITFQPVIRIAKLTADAGPGDVAPGESFAYRVVKKGDRILIRDIVRPTLKSREELGIVGPPADAPWHTDDLTVRKVGDRVWLVGDKTVTDLDSYAAVTQRELAAVERLWGDREKFPGYVLFFSRDLETIGRWFSLGETSPSGTGALGYQQGQWGVRNDGSVYTDKYVATRIVVNLGSTEAARTEPALVIRHELTHAVTARAALTGGGMLRPATWAIEGFARYSETVDAPARAAEVLGVVASGVRAGKFRNTTPPSEDFYGKDAGFNYCLGSTVFSLAEKLKGRDAAVELYATIIKRIDSADRSILELPVFEAISERVLGMSAGAFRSRWISYVRNGR